jgi:hypothetical protein
MHIEHKWVLYLCTVLKDFIKYINSRGYSQNTALFVGSSVKMFTLFRYVFQHHSAVFRCSIRKNINIAIDLLFVKVILIVI